jgi:translation elongation factor EF-1beta
MEINGVVYQYVERRVYNDSVEIRVLPNQDRLHIKNAKESIDKLASDFEQKLTDKKPIPFRIGYFKNGSYALIVAVRKAF